MQGDIHFEASPKRRWTCTPAADRALLQSEPDAERPWMAMQ